VRQVSPQFGLRRNAAHPKVNNRLKAHRRQSRAAQPDRRCKTELRTDHRYREQDRLLETGPAKVVRERALRMVQSFEQFLKTHKDEIEVLQILYSKPYAVGLSLKDVKSLAPMLRKPIDGSPRATPGQLRHACQRLDASHVRGNRTEVAAGLVNLVRFALKQKSELMPHRAEVEGRFAAWLSRRLHPLAEQAGIVDECSRRLSVLDKFAIDLPHAFDRASSLRRSILQSAFSGDVVQQDLNDEPASLLLERIRAERASKPKVSTRSKPEEAVYA
jgi:hypothetical protein